MFPHGEAHPSHRFRTRDAFCVSGSAGPSWTAMGALYEAKNSDVLKYPDRRLFRSIVVLEVSEQLLGLRGPFYLRLAANSDGLSRGLDRGHAAGRNVLRPTPNGGGHAPQISPTSILYKWPSISILRRSCLFNKHIALIHNSLISSTA